VGVLAGESGSRVRVHIRWAQNGFMIRFGADAVRALQRGSTLREIRMETFLSLDLTHFATSSSSGRNHRCCELKERSRCKPAL